MCRKKNWLVIILLLLLSCLTAYQETNNEKPFTVITNSDGSVNLTFKLPDFEIKKISLNNQTYQTIEAKNGVSTVDEGMPELPFYSVSVAVPKNSSPQLVNLTTNKEETISSVQIAPTQSLREEESKSFIINTDFYSHSNSYPQQLVKISNPQQMRDYTIININVFPFSFNPKTSSLQVNKEISFTINSNCNSTIQYQNNTKISPNFEPLYKAIISNYEQVRNPYAQYQQPSILIIYPNNANVANTISSLAKWKRQKGFVVNAVSTLETGTTNSTILAYIQNQYNNSPNPPEYVILVGDSHGSLSIPTFSKNYGFFEGTGDYPYTHVAGGDYLGDMFIGRLSIDSENTLQIIVSKIIMFEKTPTLAGTTWMNNNLLVGDTVPSGISCIHTNKYIKEEMISYDPAHQFTELYGSEPSAISMQTYASGGALFFNYRGYYGMSGFTNSNISGLTNIGKPFVGIWLTCDTGYFSSTYSVSRIETALRVGTITNPKGAICALGMSTSHTLTGYNNLMNTGMVHGLFTLGMNDMGQAQLYSKIKLVQTYSSFSAAAHDLAHWMNMMGDPSTSIYKTIPQGIVATFPSEIPQGTNSITFHTANSSTQPINDCNVNICTTNNDFYNGKTDENGNVTITFPSEVTGPYTVVITKPQYISQTSTINTQAEGIVSLNTYQITDPSGNNNSQINSGETISLATTFKNFSTQNYSNATIIMQSNSPYILIADSLINLTSFNANNISTTHNFVFTVKSCTPNNTIIPIRFKFIANSTVNYSEIALPVYGTDLTFISYNAEPNLNYIPIGTPTNLKIMLKNTGFVNLSELDAYLLTDNNNLTINDNYGSYSTILVDQQAENNINTFNITINPAVIPGTQILVHLNISNISGLIKSIPFMLTTVNPTVTNPVGPDSYGYLMFDMNDASYPEVPVYEWNSITSIGTNTLLIDSGDDGDHVTQKPLPFNFRYYGQTFNEISIGTNGWISFGATEQTCMRNSALPWFNAPSNMVAVCWSDLKFTGTGNGVFTYFDEINHTYTVQWNNVRQTYNGSSSPTFSFQIILYDSQYYPGNPNDGIMKIQYLSYQSGYSGTDDEPSNYTTVGLQNGDRTDGLTYVYNNVYNSAAAPISAQKAIFITTENNISNFSSILNMPYQLNVNEDNTLNVNISQYIEGYLPENANQYTITVPSTNHFNCVVNGLNLTLTPQLNWNGIETIQINLAYNNSNYFDICRIGVNFINDPPYVRQPILPINFIDNHSYYLLNIKNYFSDPDSLYGDHLAYNVVPVDSIGVTINNNGQVIITPAQNWSGIRTITFIATDDSLATCETTVLVTVENVNELPILNFPSNISSNEDIPIHINLVSYISDYDTNFNDLTIIVIGSQNIESLINENMLTLTPSQDWFGSQYVYISVSDDIQRKSKSFERSRSVVQDSILVNINPINDAPIIVSVTPDTTDVYVENNHLLSFTVNATDAENDNINYHWLINQILQTQEESSNTFSHTFTEEGVYTLSCNVSDNLLTTIKSWVVHVTPTANTDVEILKTELLANYPNPFNPSTRINYNLLETQNVKLKIYNAKGQLIKTLVNEKQNKGNYSCEWKGDNEQGQNVGAGIYFYVMQTNNYKKINKMLLLK